MPTFWVLANGERETGVSVHYMDEQLDNGDIIAQVKVPIEPNETHHSLIAKCKRIGADLLLQAIENMETGTIKREHNNAAEATYFTFPKRKDVEKLKMHGHKLL